MTRGEMEYQMFALSVILNKKYSIYLRSKSFTYLRVEENCQPGDI